MLQLNKSKKKKKNFDEIKDAFDERAVDFFLWS